MGPRPGYTVFGRVVEGMEVVDKIATTKTTTKSSYRDVPVKPIIIESLEITSE
jgi:cyclophilin family peptidyl-prolyl cis-trans isomerase